MDPNQDFRRFGDRLKVLRQRKGISQEQLALRAGIDRSYMGSVERGERNVSLQNILKIARAMGVRAGRLFDPF